MSTAKNKTLAESVVLITGVLIGIGRATTMDFGLPFSLDRTNLHF